MGEKQNGYIQDFETLAKILSMAFGGKKEEDTAPVPKTKGEAALMMAQVFGRR